MTTIYPPDLQAQLDQLRSRAREAANKVTSSLDDLPPEFTSAQAILVRLLLTEVGPDQTEEEWQRMCDYCGVVTAQQEDIYFNELTTVIDKDSDKPVYAQVGLGTCRRCSIYIQMYDSLTRIERVLPGMKQSNQAMLDSVKAMHFNLENVSNIERIVLVMATIEQVAETLETADDDNFPEKCDEAILEVSKLLGPE